MSRRASAARTASPARPPTDGTVADDGLDAALSALADPVRRQTVEMLAAGPCPAGELASRLGVSAPTMSKHLRVLRQNGLVTDSAPSFDARVRVYQLRREPLAGLHRWLADTERAWAEQLAAFAAHVEAKREP